MVRAGTIPIKHKNCPIYEASRKYPKVKFESSIYRMDNDSYNQFTQISMENTRDFSSFEVPIGDMLKHHVAIDGFIPRKKTAKTAIYELTILDKGNSNGAVRQILKNNGVHIYKPTIMLAHKGIDFINGYFETDKIFNSCIDNLNQNKDISVLFDHVDCKSWAIDNSDFLNAHPTLFSNIANITDEDKQLIIQLIHGDEEAFELILQKGGIFKLFGKYGYPALIILDKLIEFDVLRKIYDQLENTFGSDIFNHFKL